MRIAWFSPLPPTRSGISAYSAELLPLLRPWFRLDCYVERSRTLAASSPESLPAVLDSYDAHDFVWRHRREPYDLVVYQLGNAPCHDFMWAYLVHYPGMVVLHDIKLHQARAAHLLRERRQNDYRAEFWFDHSGAPRDLVEYAIHGLRGPVYYLWSMTRAVVRTARLVAVHGNRAAADLLDEHPGAAIEALRMGVASPGAHRDERTAIRRRHNIPENAFIFAVFGKMTAEKRIPSILRALAALKDPRVYAMFVGDALALPGFAQDAASLGIDNNTRSIGYVAHEEIDAYLQAADAALCLRWPTAGETSASWLRCLAAGLPTIVSGLAHLSDLPLLDVHTGQWPRDGRPPVALSIDLLEEERLLPLAMQMLASDRLVADRVGAAGHEHWAAHHTLEMMAADYRRAIERAASRPAPEVHDLPAHFTDGYESRTARIASHFGVEIDVLRPSIARAKEPPASASRRREPGTTRGPS
jgi:glycosyltransferase involved in cell wall biosynthesis